ncbi:hypothetical protein PIB30_040124 [Stylosanthes scabra]|uniref:Uncharacterized protein n=1 Tax=Stylosanthes scabra TaxID=79078 RepID=A0ABU6SG61_9FABA|nr:hypothetical protein [Stylosanthes scabra]
MSRKIDDATNSRLTRLITAEEVKKATFPINPFSAPGDDGFTARSDISDSKFRGIHELPSRSIVLSIMVITAVARVRHCTVQVSIADGDSKGTAGTCSTLNASETHIGSVAQEEEVFRRLLAGVRERHSAEVFPPVQNS